MEASAAVADDRAQHVRPVGEVVAARAVARAVDLQGRQRVDALGDVRENRRAGRREQLRVDWTTLQRPVRAGGDLDDGRRGNREPPVGHLLGPVAGRKRRRDDPFDVEIVQEQRDADDVRDGVVRADLVEVRRFEVGVVDGRFGLAEPSEDLLCVRFDVRGEFQRFDDLDDLRVRAVGSVALRGRLARSVGMVVCVAVAVRMVV